VGDFAEQFVSKCCCRKTRMGFKKLLATRKAKLFVSGVFGFGQAVGVKHLAITRFQRDFE
jgi:hypothetical protein